MNRIQRTALSGLYGFTLLLAVAIAACQSHQQSAPQPAPQQAKAEIKILDNPTGGQYAYGALTSQNNKADALVYMLHQVHGKFGDKPQVGRLFQSKDGSSLATFFSVNAKNMGGQPLAGLVIITMHDNNPPQVGIMYDYANHFVTSEPAMLKLISDAWQKAAPSSGGRPSSAQGQAPATPQAGPGPLQRVTAGDRSAGIGLPSGWHLTGVSGGQLTAEGPRGEMIGLGLLFQGIVDPRYGRPQGPSFSGRGPLVCSLSEGLFSAYTTIINQARRNAGKTQATFNLTSSTQLAPDGGPVRPVQAIFTVDLNDGIGPRKGSARIGAIVTRGAPTWALTVSNSNIPAQYADAEQATLMAIIRSYSQDANVIAHESAADMDRIHQAAERSRIEADAANQRREQSSQAYEEHRQALNQNSSQFDEHTGNIDWSSKITQDYILDRSVVKDNDYDATATANNRFADALVKANPNRFEIVQNQDLIRGRDY